MGILRWWIMEANIWEEIEKGISIVDSELRISSDTKQSMEKNDVQESILYGYIEENIYEDDTIDWLSVRKSYEDEVNVFETSFSCLVDLELTGDYRLADKKKIEAKLNTLMETLVKQLHNTSIFSINNIETTVKETDVWTVRNYRVR
jgi:hypothetical protein